MKEFSVIYRSKLKLPKFQKLGRHSSQRYLVFICFSLHIALLTVKGKADTYKDLKDPNGLPYIEILAEDEQVPVCLRFVLFCSYDWN
jgi:hypothetical protein